MGVGAVRWRSLRWRDDGGLVEVVIELVVD